MSGGGRELDDGAVSGRPGAGEGTAGTYREGLLGLMCRLRPGELLSEGVEHLDSGRLEVLDIAGNHGHAVHPRRGRNERVDH